MRLALAIGLACAAIASAEPEPEAPPTALFNGRDLAGWVQRGGKAPFTVENGEIVGTSLLNTPTSYLCTEKTYGDFILEFEFKVDPKLNSGVQFRSEWSDARKQIAVGGRMRWIPAGQVHGYQVEIDPDPKKDRWWSAGIYDQSRRGWLYPGPGGGDAAAFTRQGREVFKQGGWNHVRVEAIGDSIKTWINGTPRAEIKDALTPRGFIALQVHTIGKAADCDGLQVRWRHLTIREAPATPESKVNRPKSALPEDLGHWSPVVRAAAIRQATKAAPSTLPALLEALDSDNAGLRHSAAKVIATLAKSNAQKDGTEWQAVASKLIAMAGKDPDFWTRGEAAATLKHLPSPATATALIRAARDPDPWVVAAAVDAIGGLPLDLFDRQEYQDTAVRSLAAPRSATRSSGLKMIAALGPEGVQVLPQVEASVATFSRDSMFADRPRIDAIEWIARHDRRKAAALANGLLLDERWGAQGRFRRLVLFLKSLGKDAAPATDGLKRAAADKRNARLAATAANLLKSLAP